MKRCLTLLFTLLLIFFLGKGIFWIAKKIEEANILRKVVQRLSADSRIAEVLVTRNSYNEETQTIETTIKFLEYDTKGKPLEPRFFTFEGNLIQFQALVIRFDDQLVRSGDKLRGKSAYIFLRAFMLDDKNTQVFDITPVREIPNGYKIPGLQNEFEKELWQEFWAYALDPKARERSRIKNAQIEAPGTMFLPGTIYTIRIEHDGGIRIDAQPVPEILKGEKV
ncbi:MAG: hypothetical protein HY585_04340 [Candidatus Omnitrophica bacterium]|nr:hypothetical protein [Candidatus Omnitrophota bacterium]